MKLDFDDIKLYVEDYLESSKKDGMINEFVNNVMSIINQLSCSNEDKKVILNLLIQSSTLSVNMTSNIIFNILNRDN